METDYKAAEGLVVIPAIELEGASNVARISAVAIFMALLAGGGCVYYMLEDGESKGGISRRKFRRLGWN